jgi:hypothetical protein
VRTLLYVDTHSVNISADVEEVLALFQVKFMPVSAGSPQEMVFAESKVRVIKRMSTAMLLSAPHLPPNMWACGDQYSNFLGDFLPIQTRQNECSLILHADWQDGRLGSAQDKVFWSPVHIRTDRWTYP